MEGKVMPRTAKEILDNGLNNDILSFKKMLDTYSFSMGADNPDKEKLDEISNALGNIMKTNNVLEIEDNLETIGDVEGFLTEKKNGTSVYEMLTSKMSGVAKDKFDNLLKSVNGQFGYGLTDDIIKDNEQTRIQDKINEEIARDKEEQKEEEKRREKEKESEKEDDKKDKDKEEFLKTAKKNGWDSEEEQKFLSDLYDAHKVETDPEKKKKFGELMDQVSTIDMWNLDKKYGVLGMWSEQIKSLFSKGEAVSAEDMGNGLTKITYKIPSATDALLKMFANMKDNLMKEGDELMGTEHAAREKENRERNRKNPELNNTPWRSRTSYNELAKEEYGPSFGKNVGLTERVKQKEKNKELNGPAL